MGARIVLGCLVGYNGTLFAYGQTGSGKTHTMVRSSTSRSIVVEAWREYLSCLQLGPLDESVEQHGIVPRALRLLYERLEEKKAEVTQTGVFSLMQ